MILPPDHHKPRNEACPHNEDADAECNCKKLRNRKPYRVVRVNDRNVGAGVRHNIIAELHPDGRLVLREAGRRRSSAVETSLGVIYERALWVRAMNVARENKAARTARRKARK